MTEYQVSGVTPDEQQRRTYDAGLEQPRVGFGRRAAMGKRFARSLGTMLSLAALTAVGACSVSDTKAPALTGPSELGRSVSLAATPDVLSWDGQSSSTIVVETRGPNGEPLAGQSVRLEITVNGTVADFGRLSSKTVVTGSDGRGSASYTSPLPPADRVDTNTVVTLRAIPAGSDYSGAVERTVDIRLVPVGVVEPPAGTPRARFTFAPTSPKEGEDVQFDASTSLDCPPSATAESQCYPGGEALTYKWHFSDGGGGGWMRDWYRFSQAGTYTVTLTVTNSRGKSDSTSKFITVGEGANPTAEFVVSPTDPLPGTTVFFNASASKAASGRKVVGYTWDFGDGASASGVTTSHAYGAAGTYNVTLTVTDDFGKTASKSNTVTVKLP
jgi:PKD repeat protein